MHLWINGIAPNGVSKDSGCDSVTVPEGLGERRLGIIRVGCVVEVFNGVVTHRVDV